MNMSGRSRETTYFSVQRDGKTLSQQALVNSLNDFHVSINADIPPLDITTLPAFLLSSKFVPNIQPYELCKELLSIKSSKVRGPDNVPCRVLKEFLYELAVPITRIFNVSLTNGNVPGICKDSNITMIPKLKVPTSEGDISLTHCLSKILEDFVVSG